jgi:hypothetical protein
MTYIFHRLNGQFAARVGIAEDILGRFPFLELLKLESAESSLRVTLNLEDAQGGG